MRYHVAVGPQAGFAPGSYQVMASPSGRSAARDKSGSRQAGRPSAKRWVSAPRSIWYRNRGNHAPQPFAIVSAKRAPAFGRSQHRETPGLQEYRCTQEEVCTHIPVKRANPRVSHRPTPRNARPTGIWVHALFRSHPYPCKPGKLRDSECGKGPDPYPHDHASRACKLTSRNRGR